jgi:hypothetical protein
MLMQTKVILGALAAAAAVGVGVAVSKSAAAAPAPAPTPGTTPVPGVPPQGSLVWVRATTIQPGANVRVSVPLTAFTAATPAAALIAFEALLSTPSVVAALGATNFSAWGPGGPALPSDWPPDDTAAASEVHAQFVYGAALAPVLVSQLPIPGLMAWVPKGTGA